MSKDNNRNDDLEQTAEGQPAETAASDPIEFPTDLFDDILSDLPPLESITATQPAPIVVSEEPLAAPVQQADAAAEIPEEPIAAAPQTEPEAIAEQPTEAGSVPEAEASAPILEAEQTAEAEEAATPSTEEEDLQQLADEAEEAALPPMPEGDAPLLPGSMKDVFTGMSFIERARERAKLRRREQTRLRRENRKRGGTGAEALYLPTSVDEMRLTLIRLAIAAILLVLGLVMRSVGGLSFTLYLIAYLITALPVAAIGARSLTHGQSFNEYLMVFIASLGAFLLGRRPEASCVLILHSVGKIVSDTVLSRTRKSLVQQTDYVPEEASVVNMQGEERRVLPGEIAVGDFVIVRPGERIPIDGEVLRGEGEVDQTVLTGDADPVPAVKGSKVLAGSMYSGSLLLMRATAQFEDCAISQLQRVHEESAGRHAGLEDNVTRGFARLMPVICVLALVLSFLPPLFDFGSVSQWLYRALTVLIICCPTALIISIPLSFVGGSGRLAQKGIQVKGSEAIEKLAELRMVVFGKTGTLTEGKLHVKEIHTTGDFNEESCLALAATAEQLSHHPVARAVVAAYEGIPQKISEFEEFPGRGVRARIGKHNLLVGNRKLMVSRGVKGVPDIQGTVLYIAYEGDYAGAVVLEDAVRPEAKDAVAGLKTQGVMRTVILTGDTDLPAQKTADAIGIDTVHSSLTPEEKASKMEFLLRTIPTDGTAAYVGDGVNDIAELKLADVGIAMGAAGSAASAEAANVLIMSNHLGRITDAVRISRLTHSVAMQNMVLLLAVKLVLVLLTLCGIATMWQAVAVDVLLTVLAVLNAARVLKSK